MGEVYGIDPNVYTSPTYQIKSNAANAVRGVIPIIGDGTMTAGDAADMNNKAHAKVEPNKKAYSAYNDRYIADVEMQYRQFNTILNNYNSEVAFYAKKWKELCDLRDGFRYYGGKIWGPGLERWLYCGSQLNSGDYNDFFKQVQTEIGEDLMSVPGAEQKMKARKIAGDITEFLEKEAYLLDILHDTENRANAEKQAAQNILNQTMGSGAVYGYTFHQKYGVEIPIDIPYGNFRSDKGFKEDQPTYYLHSLRAVCLGKTRICSSSAK